MDGARLGATIRRLREERGWGQQRLAEQLNEISGRPTLTRSEIYRWEKGQRTPKLWMPHLAAVFGVPQEALEAASVGCKEPPMAVSPELDAVELGRRAAASDVGNETLEHLEVAFDDLATAYSVTPPEELLARTRQYMGYTAQLFDVRKTLEEHRRLVAVGGWLSLMSATLYADLNRQTAATAHLRTAVALARQAEHAELEAWCYETDAWRVLTQGDYARALHLSQAAKRLAPKGTSVAIQSTAQEGRAYARLGRARETYRLISRVHDVVSTMPRPDRPEHHYQYDPNKATSYTATTLAWVGDSAAENYAREVIDRLTPADGGGLPRRAAVAKLDLALTLLINDRLDEACDAAHEAVLSGRVAPSSHWRVLEVVKAVETRQLPEAATLRAAYEGLRRHENGPRE
ncbi:helix-turn-helix domain-containing protein [Streptomycetaceae bacterium NBC_01309]